MAIILVVDDDPAMRDALAEAIVDLGHEPKLADSGATALKLLSATTVDAALIDFRMSGMDGLELLARIREMKTPPPTAVLTAHATAHNTIEAMRLGAFDHLTKPIGREALARALSGMLATNTQRRTPQPASVREELIGSSPPMREVQKTIGMLADSNATVLITGETGTGKELAARAIHEHGHRSGKPLVAVNCAAIPADLMESELFGHVRGSFTGASGDRLGAFQQAQGGTLFLDEIGDMDLSLQAKILRALQERVVTPVGGKSMHVDVRVIAATHRDLKESVSRGVFREDLFYRLHVVPLHLPALRDRASDIVPLAEHFLQQGSSKRLTVEATALLIRHMWPGNVRELKNAIERAAVLARGDAITAADLQFIEETSRSDSRLRAWPDEALPTAVAHLEEMLIRRAMLKCAGNRAEAARVLGIHRQLLYSKLKRYGLETSEERTGDVAEDDA
jgi:DNA-binding NtrC family response regulator